MQQLHVIKSELRQVEIEQELRDNPRPTRNRMPGLDLSWFDLSHPQTRSQIFDEPEIPKPYPAQERFAQLIKNLRVQIRAARVYLQYDAYPYVKARVEKVERIEAALKRLEELSAKTKIEPGYYLPQATFLEYDESDYCWDCASRIISRTRVGLFFCCLLLQRHPKLAATLWKICDRANWWDFRYFQVQPVDYCFHGSDGMVVCSQCDALLSYSLSSYGVGEEADHFLLCEGEANSRELWQLWAVFDGAKEEGYPNFLVEKLDQLIDKYQLDSPRISVAVKL